MTARQLTADDTQTAVTPAKPRNGEAGQSFGAATLLGCVICGKEHKRRFYMVEGVQGAVCGYCVNKRYGKRAT